MEADKSDNKYQLMIEAIEGCADKQIQCSTSLHYSHSKGVWTVSILDTKFKDKDVTVAVRNALVFVMNAKGVDYKNQAPIVGHAEMSMG